MRHARQAFTMIELMIVVLIVGVLALFALGMSGASDGPYYQVRYKARQISGIMEFAMQTATNTGRPVLVEYDFPTQTVKLRVPRKETEDMLVEELREDDFLNTMDCTVGNPDDPRGSQVWLDYVETFSGERISSGRFFVEIKPIGSSIGHVAHIANRDGERFSIELNPLSGTARIYDFEKRVEEPEKD